MAANLVGKVICVTGGGRGMGRAVAELAAREGARVVDRRLRRLSRRHR